MSLDVLASQAVLQARLLERAVHDSGPWTMTCGEQTVEAQRYLTDSQITFLADFPDGLAEATVTLACNGQPLSARTVDPVASTATIRWDIKAGLVGSPQR